MICHLIIFFRSTFSFCFFSAAQREDMFNSILRLLVNNFPVFLSIQMPEVDGHWLCFNVLPIGGCLKPMRCCHLLFLGTSFFWGAFPSLGNPRPAMHEREKNQVSLKKISFLWREDLFACILTILYHWCKAKVAGCSQQHCKICAKTVYNFSCQTFA